MEYKVGDKVCVRQYDATDEHWGIAKQTWDNDLGGHVCTIDRIDDWDWRANPILVRCDHSTDEWGYTPSWWIAPSDVTLFNPADANQYDLEY